jgi:hypothetical protein
VGKGTNGRKLPSEQRRRAYHDFIAALDRADNDAGEGTVEIVRGAHGASFISVDGSACLIAPNLKIV